MDKFFASFANATAHAAGSPLAFLICIALVIAWAVSGPFFHFSENWQLTINTGTTIITFLMVFLIQNTQNRDGAALQTKLDELIRSSSAGDEFIGIEKLTDKELAELHEKCERAAKVSHAALDKTRNERVRRAHKGVVNEATRAESKT
ncbi:low affinity Fe/Cu permease [Variovorax paradoxus]|uniref:low affinity iron permease family protein n=1 Tax=Variovorax paradoxus TaxID=34073 RepID=UPI00278F6BA2|nr:low affinity iron permease family protein [Variovorax paradoxus]MDQ0571174.1 low affinity Fe/Cu permease [Variovorax paradoxus]